MPDPGTGGGKAIGFDPKKAYATFLERMNALLAGGEVPGLFDGDEYMALIN